MLSIESKSIGRWLMGLSLLSAVNILIWIRLISSGPGSSGSIEQQLVQVAGNPTLYTAGFFNAFLIAFTQVAILVILALLVTGTRRPGIPDLVGTVFALGYLVLVSIAYGSQFSLLPRVLNSPGASNSWAAILYINNPTSLVYFVDLLGYVFWGVAAILIALKFITHASCQIRGMGMLMTVAGIANIVGFVGYVSGNQTLENGVTFGGGLALAWVILTFALGRNFLKSDRPQRVAQDF